MWEEILTDLERPATIEFGIHQLERNESGRIWRRHDDRSRFDNLSNALFSDRGAYAACTGTSDYPTRKYSATGRLIVPYSAAWIQGAEIAFLARAAIPLPEVVLVDSDAMEQFSPSGDIDALQILAELFGGGAVSHGLRWLSANEIVFPRNWR